jgi:hypothetical protein
VGKNEGDWIFYLICLIFVLIFFYFLWFRFAFALCCDLGGHSEHLFSFLLHLYYTTTIYTR